MSNIYANTAQFYQFYDKRTIENLSTDAGESSPPDIPTIDAWLDAAASELEGYIEGRWVFNDPSGSTPIPLVITRLVCVGAIEIGYGRRVDVPKGVERDFKWKMDYLEKLVEGVLSIPKVGRANAPTLDSSQFKDGSSITDNIFWLGFPPTRWSVKKGNQSEQAGQ